MPGQSAFDAIVVPTLHETVARHAQAHPGRPAIRFGDRVIGYAELVSEEARDNDHHILLKPVAIGYLCAYLVNANIRLGIF